MRAKIETTEGRSDGDDDPALMKVAAGWRLTVRQVRARFGTGLS